MYKIKSINPFSVVIGALSLVIIISLVYSAFTGQLNITGTAVGRDSTWDIHFENVSSITTTGTAKVLSNHQPTINSNDPTEINDYEVSLTSPNDSISFTFDVINDGNYNASISDIDVGTPECTSTDSVSAVNMCNNLTYTLTYAGGAIVQTNDVLYAKDKLSFKVTLQFNDISNPSLLPTAGVSIGNLGIEIDFEQQGNALVNDDGTVANNRVYHIGDKITLNNEDYWIIEDSGAGQDYVVALKDLPLTVAEVNTYGSSISITATNINGYGGMPYYTSDTCKSGTISGCNQNYDDSLVKVVVDNWSDDKFQNQELKNIDGYNSSLMSAEKAVDIAFSGCDPISINSSCRDISNSPDWLISFSNWWTLTMSRWRDNIDIINSGGIFRQEMYYASLVRPVINIYKSALETNNNE